MGVIFLPFLFHLIVCCLHATFSGDSFAENAKRNVLVQAWAPLGGSLGGRFSPALQQKCAAVGIKYKKSWAQVNGSELEQKLGRKIVAWLCLRV